MLVFSPSICIRDIISLQSKFKHAPRYSTPSMSQKAIIIIIPLRFLKDRVKHWHKQSHLAPWKSKKLEDVFLWFGLIFRDNGQFWGDYIQKIPVLVGCLNPNALKKIPLFRGVFCWISFSGSLIQIFQIFQLPLRTTKLVCRLKRKWTNHLQVIFVVGPAYNYQPSRGGMTSSLITFESLESHWHLGNFAFMAYENWNASTRHDLRPRQSLVGRSLNPRTWMSQEISKWLVSGL